MKPAEDVFESVRSKSGKHKQCILYNLLESNLDPSVKNINSLRYEIVGNIMAGTEGIATTLIDIAIYLLQRPDVRERLTDELEENRSAKEQQLPFLVSMFKLREGQLNADNRNSQLSSRRA